MLKMTFWLLFSEGWALLQLTDCVSIELLQLLGKGGYRACAGVVQNVSEAEMHGEP